MGGTSEITNGPTSWRSSLCFYVHVGGDDGSLGGGMSKDKGALGAKTVCMDSQCSGWECQCAPCVLYGYITMWYRGLFKNVLIFLNLFRCCNGCPNFLDWSNKSRSKNSENCTTVCVDGMWCLFSIENDRNQKHLWCKTKYRKLLCQFLRS